MAKECGEWDGRGAFDLAAVVGIGLVGLVAAGGTAGTRFSGAFGELVVGLVVGAPAVGASSAGDVPGTTPASTTDGDVTVAPLSSEQKALVSSARMAWVSAPPVR